jgi:ABC-type branched-subunit amino acid transport system substrate-binding protein
MKGRRSTIGLALAGVSALVLSACGGSSDSSSSASESVPPDQIKTDVGVTAEPCPEAVNPTNGCIYLGIISDLTEGPFAPLATQVVAGQEAFWANVNQNGGISGYDVNVTQYTRDNKYDPRGAQPGIPLD